MLRHPIAVSTVLALVLAGCGTTGLTTAHTPAALGQASSLVAPMSSRLGAPSVTVSHDAPALQPGSAPGRQHVQSTMTVLGTDEMSDQELADDAQSLGFSIMSTAVVKTGFVRRTASGWALETTSGIFKKTTVDYALTGTAGVIAQVASHENKKARIAGTLNDAGDGIEVSTVQSAMNLGVLTNWFTKGKFDGIVKDAVTRMPIGGATIQATSQAGGFVFTDTTTPSGEFALKCLEPGAYTLTVTKTGYEATPTNAENLKARKKVHLSFDLAADH